MLTSTLSNEKFCSMMENHIQDIIEYLLVENVNFSILTNVSDVNFQPKLPAEIRDTFQPITMFVLAGYTHESALIDEDFLSFEAGFGADNYGSLVTVPLMSILQILIEDTPVFINLAIQVAGKKTLKQQKKGIKKSMEALLSNPENQKLLKK